MVEHLSQAICHDNMSISVLCIISHLLSWPVGCEHSLCLCPTKVKYAIEQHVHLVHNFIRRMSYWKFSCYLPAPVTWQQSLAWPEACVNFIGYSLFTDRWSSSWMLKHNSRCWMYCLVCWMNCIQSKFMILCSFLFTGRQRIHN